MHLIYLITEAIILICGLALIKHAHTLLIKKKYSGPAVSEYKEEQKPLAAKILGWQSLALGLFFILLTAIVNFLHLPGKTFQIGIAGGAFITILANSAMRRRLSEHKPMFTNEEWGIITVFVVILPVAFAGIFSAFSAIHVLSVLGGFIATFIIMRQRRNTPK